MNYTSKNDNKLHELTKENLSSINIHKKEFQLNENFECITIEDIEQQIKFLKSKADYLYNNLFGPRNEIGSEKEREMIDVDNFYQGMDVILSQYESISETILSNCNINNNK